MMRMQEKAANHEEKISALKPATTMSVYFNGTDEGNYSPKKNEYALISLPALLHKMTVQNETHISRCIEGCGVNNPYFYDLRIIFTYHLEQQVKDVAKQIEDLVNKTKGKVIVNIYGFSRGGVGAFLLCKKLKHIPFDRLNLNVLAFEPVPGNFITGVYADLLTGANNTISTAVSDLSDCQNIRNMLILFTNEPLPDIACHAPILPHYPNSSVVEVDVTPGCHKGAAIFVSKYGLIQPYNDESAIALHRVVEFLQRNGTTFDMNQVNFGDAINSILNPEIDNTIRIKSLKKLYDSHGNKQKFLTDTIQRSMHLSNTIFTKPMKKYLNHYHQKMHEEKVSHDDMMLLIKDSNPDNVAAQYQKPSKFIQLIFIIAMFYYLYNRFIDQPSLDYHPHGLGL